MAKRPIYYLTLKNRGGTLKRHLEFRGIDYRKIIKSVSYEHLLTLKTT